jgi:hypothetical protein
MNRPRISNEHEDEAAGIENLDLAAAAQTEACARGTILMAFRDAANRLWGETGTREIGSRLSPKVRAETIELAAVNLVWVPEAYVLEWYQAVWDGPCEARSEAFRIFLDRMLDSGFGRVRKAFLGLAKPPMILGRAPSLWRHDHTHGALTVEGLKPGSARVRLADHPYTETPLGCLAIAEIYRYCIALCRVDDATEIHYREPNGALVVRLRWQA